MSEIRKHCLGKIKEIFDEKDWEIIDTFSEHLNETIFDKYRFATITFEHDIYTGNYFNTRELSRKILISRGYILLFPDVSVFWEGAYKPFEDWYIHPALVDPDILKLQTTDSLNTEQINKILNTN